MWLGVSGLWVHPRVVSTLSIFIIFCGLFFMKCLFSSPCLCCNRCINLFHFIDCHECQFSFLFMHLICCLNYALGIMLIMLETLSFDFGCGRINDSTAANHCLFYYGE